MLVARVPKRSMKSLAYGLCLLLIGSVVTSPLYDGDDSLYEGDNCKLEDDGDGICKNVLDCPTRIQEVRAGKRSPAGRCGFVHDTEVVCCPPNTPGKIGLRPADRACQQYENDVITPARQVSYHIWGGKEADKNEFPFMAALGYNSTDYSERGIQYTCGGTLISPQHVLTAAHCVNNIQEKVPVEVRLGSTDLAVEDKETQRIPVEEIILHPKNKRSTNYYDVAIIRLKTPVRVTNSVRPACLLSRSLTGLLGSDRNGSLTVMGWGYTDVDTKPSKLMKAAGLRYVDKAECSKSYGQFRRLPQGLDDSMYCILDADTKRRADACWGDSGGPLLYSSESIRAVAGVTGFGQFCGGPIPGVYASVFEHLDWIEAQTWPNVED